MSGILKTYDLSAVKLAIGGILLGGYAEDGGIEVEPAAPVGEFSSGADGEAVFSRSNNDAVFVTITVNISDLINTNYFDHDRVIIHRSISIDDHQCDRMTSYRKKFLNCGCPSDKPVQIGMPFKIQLVLVRIV